MTHSAMPSRPSWFASLAVIAVLAVSSLAGCTTLHGWAQLGSDHPSTAGASVTLPLGK
jgi:hypothetical protein